MPSLIDLTGKRFGRWTVLEKAPSKGKSGARWVCKCECGTVKEIQGQTLRRGQSKSCGCEKSKYMSDAWLAMRKEKELEKRRELIGKRFGRWTIVSQADDKVTVNGKKTVKQRYWNCLCDCGAKKEVSEQTLLNGESKSCGCLKVDFFAKYNKREKPFEVTSSLPSEPSLNDMLALVLKKKSQNYDIQEKEEAIRKMFPSFWTGLVREEQGSLKRKYPAIGTCEKCGKESRLELHHIRPVKEYGGNESENIIAVCHKCHMELEKEKRCQNSV